jgi:thiosulfate reductase cytochrome b subunit
MEIGITDIDAAPISQFALHSRSSPLFSHSKVAHAVLPGLAVGESDILDPPRHSAVVRVTHWITALAFVGLLLSGVAILLAHPRLYWGETGGLGAPSVLDLPIPLKLGHSGWGRYLHFLSAWVCVLNGLLYGLSGFFTKHFRRNLLPAKADLSWVSTSRIVSNYLRLRRPTEEESLAYNVLQRLVYLGVVFLLFPLAILSGLAMSPAITSVVPALVNGLGGQQSTRTIHFFVASLLVLFFFVHIAMLCLAGFANRVRAMITGYNPTGKSLCARHSPGES